MDKIFTIAAREYKAAVRSKAFILTMLMMPIFSFGSILVQVVLEKVDVKEMKIAVVDRSEGGKLGEVLKQLVDENSEFKKQLTEATKKNPEIEKAAPQLKELVSMKMAIETIPPSKDDKESILQQRYELSQRVENGELDGFVEIGKEVYKPITKLAEEQPDDQIVKLRFKNAIEAAKFRFPAQFLLTEAVQVQRFNDKKLNAFEIKPLLAQVIVEPHSLVVKDKLTGELKEGKKGAQFVNLFLPAALIGLMFMVIMVGATPAMQGIVEEKSQRIAEVILGSVSPFQLMAGKLVGVIGVALTMASVYLLGGYFVAYRYGYADLLSPVLLFWFGFFLILALLIYGSLFIAVGAAAVDIKDTQSLMMPIMLIACIPLFALSKIISDPNGMIATVASFFPFGTPMIMVARQSVPRAYRFGSC